MEEWKLDLSLVVWAVYPIRARARQVSSVGLQRYSYVQCELYRCQLELSWKGESYEHSALDSSKIMSLIARHCVTLSTEFLEVNSTILLAIIPSRYGCFVKPPALGTRAFLRKKANSQFLVPRETHREIRHPVKPVVSVTSRACIQYLMRTF